MAFAPGISISQLTRASCLASRQEQSVHCKTMTIRRTNLVDGPFCQDWRLSDGPYRRHLGGRRGQNL